MVAYKLILKDNEAIELYFKEDKSCSLTVKDLGTYEFMHSKNGLSVTWIISDIRIDEIKEPAIISVQAIDFKQEYVDAIPKSLRRTNCCSIGGKEYCVKNGCMNAPCGHICG